MTYRYNNKKVQKIVKKQEKKESLQNSINEIIIKVAKYLKS